MTLVKYPFFTLFFLLSFLCFSIRMSEKGGKKKTIKNNKKVSKDKKTVTLKFNNSVEIPEKNIYQEDSRISNINDIDIKNLKNFTTKNMIHTSIVLFMKMVMNIFF